MEEWMFWIQMGVFIITYGIIFRFLKQRNDSLQITINNLKTSLDAHKSMSDSSISQMQTVIQSLSILPGLFTQMPSILDSMAALYSKQIEELKKSPDSEQKKQELMKYEEIKSGIALLRTEFETTKKSLNKIERDLSVVAANSNALQIFPQEENPLDRVLKGLNSLSSPISIYPLTSNVYIPYLKIGDLNINASEPKDKGENKS